MKEIKAQFAAHVEIQVFASKRRNSPKVYQLEEEVRELS
jgi:hypothetical protein